MIELSQARFPRRQAGVEARPVIVTASPRGAARRSHRGIPGVMTVKGSA